VAPRASTAVSDEASSSPTAPPAASQLDTSPIAATGESGAVSAKEVLATDAGAVLRGQIAAEREARADVETTNVALRTRLAVLYERDASVRSLLSRHAERFESLRSQLAGPQAKAPLVSPAQVPMGTPLPTSIPSPASGVLANSEAASLSSSKPVFIEACLHLS
jgi:hypothetical protein